MKSLNAVLIGNGTMGKRHRSRFESCNVDFVKVWDVEAENVMVREFENLCSKKKVDFAVVASPASTHYKYVKFLLENRIPVLVEKPLATSGEKALELVSLAKAKETLLFVAQSECYNPLFLNFRKFFLGELRRLPGDVAGLTRLEFRREHGFTERCRDVDVSLDLLVHDVSLFLNLFGNEGVKVLDSTRNGSDFAKMTLQVSTGRFAGVTADVIADRNSSRDVRTIAVDWPDDSSYSMSLAHYDQNGSVAHVPDSLDNEHRFFLKLLAGACKDWAVRAMDNAANAVALADWSN